MGHAALGRIGGHRAMQATFAAPGAGTEALDELSFQQLLDLQDEASEDDSFDTFNDVARELKTRRDGASDALKRLFADRCDNGGTLPMVAGAKLVQVDIAEVVRETMSTNWGTELGTELVLHPHARASVIARLAADFAELCCEDNLRAGWAE
jgi:hypothetical protein